MADAAARGSVIRRNRAPRRSRSPRPGRGSGVGHRRDVAPVAQPSTRPARRVLRRTRSRGCDPGRDRMGSFPSTTSADGASLAEGIIRPIRGRRYCCASIHRAAGTERTDRRCERIRQSHRRDGRDVGESKATWPTSAGPRPCHAGTNPGVFGVSVSANRIAQTLTWLGGGEWRELGERHERSTHVIAGVVVLLGAALAWLVATLAITEATNVSIAVVVPFTLAFGLLVGAVSRAIASGPTRGWPNIVGRAAVAIV